MSELVMLAIFVAVEALPVTSPVTFPTTAPVCVPALLPVKLPVTLPVTAPARGPENAVADSVPPPVQLGPPVLNLAGVMPPSLTMMAPPESCVVVPSTAPDTNVAASTKLLRLVALICVSATIVAPLDRMAML